MLATTGVFSSPSKAESSIQMPSLWDQLINAESCAKYNSLTTHSDVSVLESYALVTFELSVIYECAVHRPRVLDKYLRTTCHYGSDRRL